MHTPARKLATQLTVAICLTTLACAGHAADGTERHQLSIQRGSVPEVLRELSEQTGVSIRSEISIDETKTTELGPFVGHATAEEALQQLLRGGRDLWYRRHDDSTLGVILISGQYSQWFSGSSTAKEASDAIHGLSGAHFETGLCGDYVVGPIDVDESVTAEGFWIQLIKPYCSVVKRQKHSGAKAGASLYPQGIGSTTAAEQYDFAIGRVSRMQAVLEIATQADVLIGYLSNDLAEERALVGPIEGRMSVDAALAAAVDDADLYMRWVDTRILSVEPTSRTLTFADMTVCPCNFGFPEWRPPASEHVTVVGSRLRSIEEFALGRVASWDRRDIEATGASTIPDFLRHATQLPYMQPKGATLTGAQYAALHGLDPKNTLVLLNGTRADVSASDVSTSAFDLNTVPISAVERIEIGAASPSVVYGIDAVAGIINIVLRDSVPEPFAAVRYGSASGGARERIGSAASGTSTERATTAFFVDYSETSELLGSHRDRWRNQDYTRYGEVDRRSRFAGPPNVYTLDGQNLPGLDAPEAAVSILPSGEIAFQPHHTNLTSSLATQAIVPAMSRASIFGAGRIDMGSSTISAEGLWVRRNAHFQMNADIVPGLTLAADHPANPFNVPIAVDAALTGLPPRATDSRSELTRGVIRFERPIGTWRYHSFLRYSKERASSFQLNFVDSVALMNGLASSDDDAINIFTERPGEFDAASLLAPRHSRSAESGGTHISARANGPLPLLGISATLGVEYRTEFVNFNEMVDQVSRHVASTFGVLNAPVGDLIDLTYGTRIDDFGDLDRIRREQWGLRWRVTPLMEWRAAYNEAYHMPSLYDLYLPRGRAPSPMFDPQRQEVLPVDFIFGGNPSLTPTTGTSSTVGFKIETPVLFKAHVDVWRVRMRNEVAAVSPFALLAHEDAAIVGRIVRDQPTLLDNQLGRPGRLLALDVTRANFGQVDTRGVDISTQLTFETSLGTLAPRLDATYTDTFRFNDLPIRDAPLHDRSGIASVLGTVPTWRATFSLGYSGYDWDVHLFARYHSSYRDYDSVTGARLDRDIPSRALFDVTLAKNIAGRIKLSVGVTDVLDRAPPYSQVNDPAGIDMSQVDLAGRSVFIQASGSM